MANNYKRGIYYDKSLLFKVKLQSKKSNRIILIPNIIYNRQYNKALNKMAEPRQNIQIVAEDFIDGPPLDFSFQNITELTEIIRKQPRSGQRLPIP